jgi:hypothetical protein
MDEGIQRFAARLQERLGGSLRGVFYGDFRQQEYDVAYASEDALDGYGPGHVEEVVDEVALYGVFLVSKPNVDYAGWVHASVFLPGLVGLAGHTLRQALAVLAE